MARSTPYQYPVCLSGEQRQRLEELCRTGCAPVRKVMRARVLLLSDQNQPAGHKSRREIAEAMGIHVNSVDRIRKQFVVDGEVPALNRKPRETPPTPPILDGRAEAHLVAICCSDPPTGRVCWTMELLTQELTQRQIVTKISAETVRRALKKTNCNLGASNAGVSRNAIMRGSFRKWKKCSMSIPPNTVKKNH